MARITSLNRRPSFSLIKPQFCLANEPDTWPKYVVRAFNTRVSGCSVEVVCNGVKSMLLQLQNLRVQAIAWVSSIKTSESPDPTRSLPHIAFRSETVSHLPRNLCNLNFKHQAAGQYCLFRGRCLCWVLCLSIRPWHVLKRHPPEQVCHIILRHPHLQAPASTLSYYPRAKTCLSPPHTAHG